MTKFPALMALLMMLVMPLGLLAGPGPVQLQYLPDSPVLQTSSVQIELVQQGDASQPVTAFQEVKARLQIAGNGRQGPILHLPVDVSIDLEGIKVGSEAKGKTMAFDSHQPGTSPLMNELSKVIGHPMNITVGEDLQVTTQSKDFIKLLQNLESLGGFRASSLVSEMFEHLFALAGHDLRVGQEYTQHLALGADENIPVTITYKVAAITDSEVRATVTGGFSTIDVDHDADGHKDNGVAESLLLSGRIDGKAVWSRKNALIYKTRLDYIYEGRLKEGDRQIPIRVTVRHEDVAKAL